MHQVTALGLDYDPPPSFREARICRTVCAVQLAKPSRLVSRTFRSELIALYNTCGSSSGMIERLRRNSCGLTRQMLARHSPEGLVYARQSGALPAKRLVLDVRLRQKLRPAPFPLLKPEARPGPSPVIIGATWPCSRGYALRRYCRESSRRQGETQSAPIALCAEPRADWRIMRVYAFRPFLVCTIWFDEFNTSPPFNLMNQTVNFKGLQSSDNCVTARKWTGDFRLVPASRREHLFRARLPQALQDVRPKGREPAQEWVSPHLRRLHGELDPSESRSYRHVLGIPGTRGLGSDSPTPADPADPQKCPHP